MAEKTSTQKTSENRLNVAIAIIVAVIALLGSFITKIESDASTLSSIAGNEEQQYYYEAIGKEISGAADVNYSFGTVYQLWYQYDVQLTAFQKSGDANAIQTYTELRDSVAKTSDLFAPAYFNPETGQINLLRYKADRYGTAVYALQEQQRAASDVSAAWGDKSSIYVLQLTLLAVAGFLLGLALMSRAKIPTLIFAFSGISMVLFITVWAYLVYRVPVFDLRQTEAITFFAKASSLSDQKSWEEALKMYTRAIDAAGPEHPYGRAYLHRARAYAVLEQFESAIQDFQSAQQMGEDDPTLNASLVRAYYQTGDFQSAIAIGNEALNNSPDDLWLRQQVNLALLASGDTQVATREYQNLIDRAAQQVARQRQLGDTPSEIWWLIDEATFQLDQLGKLLKSDVKSSVRANIKDVGTISLAAQEIADLLRARSIAMQYNLTETVAPSNASIGKPGFVPSKTPDGKYVHKIEMQFTYSAFEPGQMMIFKVYRNGIQDPSWSFNQRWSGKNQQGQANFTLSPSYSSLYIVPPGLYAVDIYINDKIVQQGEFTVDNPEAPFNATGTESEANYTQDMFDPFDFYAEGFAYTGYGDGAAAQDYYDDPSYYNDPTFYFYYDQYYPDFFDQTYDFDANDCNNPDDLACSTTDVDCTLNPDDPSCCDAAEAPACASDPNLSADDPNCGLPSDLTTEESSSDPTTEESSSDPTSDESSPDPTTEEPSP